MVSDSYSGERIDCNFCEVSFKSSYDLSLGVHVIMEHAGEHSITRDEYRAIKKYVDENSEDGVPAFAEQWRRHQALMYQREQLQVLQAQEEERREGELRKQEVERQINAMKQCVYPQCPRRQAANGEDIDASGNKACHRCGTKPVYYCGGKCQKADWKRHKKECGKK
eukprot:TRINITY_DN19106_c0_g1_i1.p1 TRINITY_DN19106_c0_g1~~TRINITY_DN19106_c0_g1_i1.p1  ORF type:complete len:167 (-),score=24.95 TRINITY_DN19106_c0_g1_i1:28-528(-)